MSLVEDLLDEEDLSWCRLPSEEEYEITMVGWNTYRYPEFACVVCLSVFRCAARDEERARSSMID